MLARSSNVLLMSVDSLAVSAAKLFRAEGNYNFRVRCICAQRFIFCLCSSEHENCLTRKLFFLHVDRSLGRWVHAVEKSKR